MKENAFKIGDIVRIKLKGDYPHTGKIGEVIKIEKFGKNNFKVCVKVEGKKKPSWFMLKSSLELVVWRIA